MSDGGEVALETTEGATSESVVETVTEPMTASAEPVTEPVADASSTEPRDVVVPEAIAGTAPSISEPEVTSTEVVPESKDVTDVKLADTSPQNTRKSPLLKSLLRGVEIRVSSPPSSPISLRPVSPMSPVSPIATETRGRSVSSGLIGSLLNRAEALVDKRHVTFTGVTVEAQPTPEPSPAVPDTESSSIASSLESSTTLNESIESSPSQSHIPSTSQVESTPIVTNDNSRQTLKSNFESRLQVMGTAIIVDHQRTVERDMQDRLRFLKTMQERCDLSLLTSDLTTLEQSVKADLRFRSDLLEVRRELEQLRVCDIENSQKRLIALDMERWNRIHQYELNAMAQFDRELMERDLTHALKRGKSEFDVELSSKEKALQDAEAQLLHEKFEFEMERRAEFSETLKEQEATFSKRREQLEKDYRKAFEEREKKSSELEELLHWDREKALQDIFRSQSSHDEAKDRFFQSHNAQFLKLLELSFKTADELCRERKEKSFIRWESKEGELAARELALDESLDAHERDAMKKYETLLMNKKREMAIEITRQREAFSQKIEDKTKQLREITRTLEAEVDAMRLDMRKREQEKSAQCLNLEDALKERYNTDVVAAMNKIEESRKQAASKFEAEWVEKENEYRQRLQILTLEKNRFEIEVRNKFEKRLIEKVQDDLLERKELAESLAGELQRKDVYLESLRQQSRELEQRTKEILEKSRVREMERWHHEQDIIWRSKERYSEEVQKSRQLLEERDAKSATKWSNRERDLARAESVLEDSQISLMEELRQKYDLQFVHLREESAARRREYEANCEKRIRETDESLQFSRDRLQDLEELTRRLMDRKVEQDAAHRAREDSITFANQDKLKSLLERCNDVLRRQEDDLYSELDRRETGFLEREEVLERSRADAVVSTIQKYEGLLIKHKTELFTSISAYAHEWQVQVKETIDGARDKLLQCESDLTDFETECDKSYHEMIVDLVNKNEADRAEHIASEMTYFKKKCEEEIGQQRMWTEVRGQAITAVRERFDRILTELKESWAKEAEERRKMVAASVRQHYEVKVAYLRRRAEKCVHDRVQSEDEVRQLWSAEVAQMKRRQQQQVDEMMERLTRRFQHDAVAQKKIISDLVFRASSELSDTVEIVTKEKLKRLRELHYSRLKMIDNKVSSQSAIYEKYEPMIKKLREKESEFLLKLESSVRQRVALSEQSLLEAAEECLETSHMTRETSEISVDVIKQRMKECEDFLITIDGRRQMLDLRPKVERAWDEVAITNQERLKFLSYCRNLLPECVELCDVYEAETVRLTDRLPIIQAVTRREELRSAVIDVVTLVNQAAISGQKLRHDPSMTTQMEQVGSELSALHQWLRDAVPQYERLHRERIMVRGTLYMDIQAEESIELRAQIERLVNGEYLSEVIIASPSGGTSDVDVTNVENEPLSSSFNTTGSVNPTPSASPKPGMMSVGMGPKPNKPPGPGSATLRFGSGGGSSSRGGGSKDASKDSHAHSHATHHAHSRSGRK